MEQFSKHVTRDMRRRSARAPGTKRRLTDEMDRMEWKKTIARQGPRALRGSRETARESN